LWAWLSHAWGGWRSAVHIVDPETDRVASPQVSPLLDLESRHRTGRPALPPDVRALIRDMSIANPLWGAPRIHGELLTLGIAVSQSTVAKYTRRHARPPSQTWRTFLTNSASQIMAADLFVVPTVTFRLLFVLIMLAHDRRRLVHVAVTAHPTAAWTAQQLRNAFPENETPRHLLHDRDSVFAHVATTLEGMGIEDVRTAPRSPWQNAYVERVIGSIRRECLDHVIVVNAAGLHRVLTDYIAYYMRSRTHLALAKDTPITRPTSPLSAGRIVVTPGGGGLHHRYDRIAA
jgi:transposase InsO family protein